MANINYEDAVQLLKRRLGGTWEGEETGGRDEMERVLRDEMGLSRTDASSTIDAMMASGTLRYHRDTANNPDARDDRDVENDVVNPAVPVAPAATFGAPAGTTSGSGGLFPPAAIIGTGHWEIGSGEETSEAAGRKGQVDPT